MKERPILFNTDMVKAILDGRKTQTRRPVKNQPKNGWAFENGEKGGAFGRIKSKHPKKDKFGAFIRRGVGTDFPEVDIEVCPFGMPGDRLWVRETWRQFNRADECGCYENCSCPSNGEFLYYADWGDSEQNWKPSIHMPRRACRLMLEITDVRIERVQETSEQDAWAEGCEGYDDDVTGGQSGYGEFMELWDSVYGKNEELNVNANPWVWVIEFKIVELNGKKQEQAA